MGQLDTARSRLPTSLTTRIDTYVNNYPAYGALTSLLVTGIPSLLSFVFLDASVNRNYLFAGAIASIIGGLAGGAILGSRIGKSKIEQMAKDHEAYATEIRRYANLLSYSGRYHDSDDD
ncbi:MAG: hypothetical protein ACP5NS_00340 [Candidatus Pacearchaeota archaeon]